MLLSSFIGYYAKYRVFGFECYSYDSVPKVIWKLGYTDIIVVLLTFTLLLLWFFFFCKKNVQIERRPVFICDTPIENQGDDLLDYSDSARELARELESIELRPSFSIGLLAPWGAGKTSFLNLLETFLDEDKFIIVKFNPRHSFSPNNIQEDFFECLVSELKKYDSTFNSSFTDYLKAINILAESKVVSTFFGLHKLWDKQSKKTKISKAIKNTGKRIVVIIDDFDRLLADEIIEIFKLIDENASFSNVIFITAYNKVLINKILSEKYNNVDSYFSEKFFTLEIPIPLRDYNKTYNFLKSTLLSKNIVDDAKMQIIEKYYGNGILKKYIRNLRDAKRFINLLIWQYSKIYNDVVFEDYFLLSLIQNKYFEDYFILQYHQEQYISEDFMKMPGRLYLNKSETFQTIPKCKDILEILFSDNITTPSMTSIKDKSAFNIYFRHKVYDGIEMSNLDSIFINPLDVVKSTIDNWVLNNKLNYLLTYLDSKDIFGFNDSSQFERYLDILLYINCKNYSVDIPSFKIYSFLYKENQDKICNKYSLSENDYKTMLSIKLKGQYPEYPYNITQSIITGLIDNQFQGEIIFNRAEVLDIAKIAFNDFVSRDPIVNQEHINMLYSCISNIESKTQLVTLDKDACLLMKKIIEANPAGYFSKFVRLGMWSTNPEYNSVACEPFWKQIFGNENEIKVFIGNHQSKIPNIRIINNFWELYENNSYKPIPFENQGNVQDKINNNLEAEFQTSNTIKRESTGYPNVT